MTTPRPERADVTAAWQWLVEQGDQFYLGHHDVHGIAEILTFWGWLVRADHPPGGPVRVDPDAFAPGWRANQEHGSFHEGGEVAVEAPDAAAARRALERAADRFAMVFEDGAEARDDAHYEELEQSWPHDWGRYSPNFVYPPARDGAGWCVSMDTKGVRYDRMLRTQLRILVEELVGADVQGAVVRARLSHRDQVPVVWAESTQRFVPRDAPR